MRTVKTLLPASLGYTLGEEIASFMRKVCYVWGRLYMS